MKWAMLTTTILLLMTVLFVHADVEKDKVVETEIKEVDNHIIVKLNDSPPDTGKTPLDAVIGIVETDKVQFLGTGGLKGLITIANESDNPIAFLNPFDFMHITVADQQGQVIDLPSVPHRFKINTRGPEQNKIQLPFKLGNVTLNDKVLTKDELSKRVFQLLAGERLQIPVEIDKIVKKVETEPQIIDVPAGNYQVKLSLRIGDPTNVNVRRQLESQFIQISLSDKAPTAPK